MDIKNAIELGFETLETLTEVSWPSNNRINREILIKAFIQNEVPPYKYLGYSKADGLSKVLNRSIKDYQTFKDSPRQQPRNFILYISGHFECNSCSTVKELSDRVKEKSNLCKECSLNRLTNKVKQGRKYIYEYFKAHPCVDCGQSNPIVLEFDHLVDKKYNVSSMVAMPIEDIKVEIQKCEVVCANCHKIRTAKAQNWYKGL